MSRWAAMAVAAAAVLETGCLVQVTKVSDPRPIFQQARLEAKKLAGRRGPAREVNVLAYAPDEKQLVRVSVPMWLVRKMDRHVDVDWDDVNVDGDTERMVRRATRRVDLDDLAKAGLGTFVEVDEEDGEQVLVWLK